jgi:uncharacterized protein YebE (UPF0316 family)
MTLVILFEIKLKYFVCYMTRFIHTIKMKRFFTLVDSLLAGFIAYFMSVSDAKPT